MQTYRHIQSHQLNEIDIMIDVAVDGTAWVRRLNSADHEGCLPLREAVAKAHNFKVLDPTAGEIVVHLQDGAEWDHRLGDLVN